MQVRVRVVPNSSKDEVVGLYDGALKVKVCAVPEKGKANKAVIELMVTHYGVNKSQVVLLSGETSSHKVFEILGSE